MAGKPILSSESEDVQSACPAQAVEEVQSQVAGAAVQVAGSSGSGKRENSCRRALPGGRPRTQKRTQVTHVRCNVCRSAAG